MGFGVNQSLKKIIIILIQTVHVSEQASFYIVQNNHQIHPYVLIHLIRIIVHELTHHQQL